MSLGVAFFLGSIFEILGAVYLSGEVVSSIAGANSVVNMPLYHSHNATECGLFMLGSAAAAEAPLLRERTLMLGLVTSMVASQIWQLIATYLAWPVSGTHTIISALMGFTIVEKGAQVRRLNNKHFHFISYQINAFIKCQYSRYLISRLDQNVACKNSPYFIHIRPPLQHQRHW